MPYYFTLPLITTLTLDQQRAIDETRPLALKGGPGTGKSVVCLWRHIRNHSTGTCNSLLLTYTRTLEHYLKQSAKTQNDNAAESIDRVLWWLHQNARPYDEIIIDEGQDINIHTFQQFFNYTNNLSFGADERQSIYISEAELQELTNWHSEDNRFAANEKITLNRNFRNSREILEFTRSVFPNFLIPQNVVTGAHSTGIKPIMKINLGWGADNQFQEIISIIRDYQSDTHNIAVLLPFAGSVGRYYNLLRSHIGNEVEISMFENNIDTFSGLAGVHVTTFHSSKGTEFDTVIIPEFDSLQRLVADQRYQMITESSYYVAITRTRTNLFLLCSKGIPNFVNRNSVTIE